MRVKDLEIHHCRVLVAVSDHGGVAAAARALRLAQSTVSETLLSLERVLGAPVTARRPGKEASLTASAEKLLPHARTLIAASEAAVAAFASKGRQVIRVGTVESVSSFLLPGPLKAFRRQWPQVDVRISIGLCDDLRKRAKRHELDAALTMEAASRARDTESRVLLPTTLRLVVSRRHPLARKKVARNDLARQTFLLADSGGAFADLLDAWFENSSLPLRSESAGSIDGVKRGLKRSNSIGVLPDYAVAKELGAGSFVALRLVDPPPPIALLLTSAKPVPKDSPLHDLIAEIGRRRPKRR
jgi:DNA-binding transcriptional LysR family regulator